MLNIPTRIVSFNEFKQVFILQYLNIHCVKLTRRISFLTNLFLFYLKCSISKNSVMLIADMQHKCIAWTDKMQKVVSKK